MSKSKDYFISLADIAGALGVLEGDLLEWVKEDNPEIDIDHINRKAARLLSY